MRGLRCEACSSRKAAAKVELDGDAMYLCRPCTQAVQAHYTTQARCEDCENRPSAVTKEVNGEPKGLCEECAGNTIEEKKDAKKKEKNSSLAFGVAAEQGRRPTMEDADVAIPDLSGLVEGVAEKSAFYAVFDGHGGQRAAEFVAKTLHHKIFASSAFGKGEIREAILEGYRSCDDELLRLCDAEGWQDGCTAIVALILGNTLWTSNVGDSELVACVDGKAQCRSFKHKPTVPEERARIQAANGVVLFDRLGASMAVSRSFGDKIHKHPFNDAPADHMSAEPFIDEMPLDDCEFLIVACDGLWDTFEYDDAVAYVQKKKKKGKSAESVAAAIVQESLDRGSTDNVSCIIVYFK